MPPCSADPPLDRVGRPLADLAAVEIQARHPGRGGEGDEGVLALELTLPDVEAVLGQHHDGAALGGLVGQRGQLGRVGHVLLAVPAHGIEVRRHPVAQGDGAGLVQQQRLHVAGGLDRPTAHGQHVALHQAVHAGDADGGEQGPDGGRDQADQQRDQDHHRDASLPRSGRTPAGTTTTGRKTMVSTASRMVRAISLGVFCRLAPSTRVIIRSKKVWPRSAVMRTTMRSERTLVPPVTAERSPPDSRMTGADSPVMADSSTEAMPSMISPSEGIRSLASQTTRSPLASSAAGTSSSVPSASQAPGLGLRSHPPQRVGLRLAPALGHGLGEVGEDHRQEEPDGDGPGEDAGVGDGLDEGDDRADEHHEHDRVADLDAGFELLERVDQGLAQDLAVEEAAGLGDAVGFGARCAGLAWGWGWWSCVIRRTFRG